MAELSHLDKYKFRRDLEEIEAAAGRGTELVTVYVPPDKLISDVANYLRGEYSQSSNIKSQSTRKHVQGAIESMKNVQSQVPRKHRMGGQSAHRFERLHEQAVHEFFKKIGDLMTDAFLSRDLAGILVAGPGYTKEEFAKGGYIHHELMKKIITPFFDVGYTDENGLREIVEAARPVLTGLDLMREKELVQRLMEEIRKPEGGLAAYGESQVRHAVELGAVDLLLISEGLRKVRAKVVCANCGYTNEGTYDRDRSLGPCPNCGQERLAASEQRDLVEELTEKAIPMGSKVELVSRDSEEGDLFLKAFAGLAAILRYRVT